MRTASGGLIRRSNSDPPLAGTGRPSLGGFRVLVLGGLTLVPAAGLWAVSGNFWFLRGDTDDRGRGVGRPSASGFFCFFLETMPERERTSVLTKYNVINALSMSIGSVAGGWLIEFNGKTIASYLLVFALSSGVRGLALTLLPRIVRKGEDVL